MITTRQKIAVAKDRALDELACLAHPNHWWNLSPRELSQAHRLAAFLANPRATVKQAKALNLINGEEYVYYEIVE